MPDSRVRRQYRSQSLAQTEAIGQEIYSQIEWPCCVYLQGQLGSGKTSLSQAIIHAAGYRGAVTSPTYNLIQEYPLDGAKKRTIYHMDLYRLEDPQELLFLGIEDLWQSSSLFLIEWPEKAHGMLQPATIKITMSISEGLDGRIIELQNCNLRLFAD